MEFVNAHDNVFTHFGGHAFRQLQDFFRRVVFGRDAKGYGKLVVGVGTEGEGWRQSHQEFLDVFHDGFGFACGLLHERGSEFVVELVFVAAIVDVHVNCHNGFRVDKGLHFPYERGLAHSSRRNEYHVLPVFKVLLEASGLFFTVCEVVAFNSYTIDE